MATANNCYATGDVISSDDLAGGLIGYLYDGSLANSCSTGKVQGNICVGGLVGKQRWTKLASAIVIHQVT